MENNLRINNSLTRLTSTKRVKSVGHRQNGHHQNSFKETFQKRQKKKNDKTEDMDKSSRSYRKLATEKTPPKNNALKTIVKTSSTRTIDITV